MNGGEKKVRSSFLLCLVSFFLTATLVVNTTDDISVNGNANDVAVSAQELVINDEAITDSVFFIPCRNLSCLFY